MQAAVKQNSWMFFNGRLVSYNQGDSSVGPSFEINIFLEDGAHKHTSGVQLLIVKKANSGAILDQPITMYESVVGSILKRTTSSDLRVRLLTQKASKITPSDRAGNEYNAFTVILEYSYQPHTDVCHTLIPFVPSNSPDMGCQVIHNRFISVSDTSRGLIVRLTVIQPELPTRDKPTHPLTSYVLRILPTHGRRQLSLNLPPNIVERIVEYALEYLDSSWATEIFNYALVQKGWVHLLSLFWRRLASTRSMPRPYLGNPLGISSALAARPELRRYFSRYSDNIIPIYDSPRRGGLASTTTGSKESTLAEANCAIMRECSQVVTEVYLAHLHNENFDTIIEALPSLERVHLFECSLPDVDPMHKEPGVQYLNPLWGLVYAISGWQCLENLKVTMSSKAQFGYHDRSIPLEYSSLPFSLKVLSICDEKMPQGTQPMFKPWFSYLFRLLFSYPTQRLIRLTLEDIGCLSEGDLLFVFTTTKLTLEYIRVSGCLLVRDEERNLAGGERILDVSLAEMQRLSDVIAQEDIVSPLSLTRKYHNGDRGGKIRILRGYYRRWMDAYSSVATMSACSWSEVIVDTLRSRGNYNFVLHRLAQTGIPHELVEKNERNEICNIKILLPPFDPTQAGSV